MRRQRGECARSSDIALKLKVVRKWTAIKSCATLFTRLKDTIRNLAKYWNILREERGSRNWHPRSERQSIYQAREAENPEWPSARREGRKEERVARKMTINNWCNAPSRGASFPPCSFLPRALIVIAKKEEEEEKRARSSSAERQMRDRRRRRRAIISYRFTP